MDVAILKKIHYNIYSYLYNSIPKNKSMFKVYHVYCAVLVCHHANIY